MFLTVICFLTLSTLPLPLFTWENIKVTTFVCKNKKASIFFWILKPRACKGQVSLTATSSTDLCIVFIFHKQYRGVFSLVSKRLQWLHAEGGGLNPCWWAQQILHNMDKEIKLKRIGSVQNVTLNLSKVVNSNLIIMYLIPSFCNASWKARSD